MPLTSENLPRHRPDARGWYEVWYSVVWDVPGRNAFWIRYTALAPSDPQAAGECALWFVRYCADHPDRNLALKQSFPLDRLARWPEREFRLQVAEAVLDDGRCRGGLSSGEHEASWDLKWFSGGEPYRSIPETLRRRAKSDVVVPHWNGCVTGEVRVDGNVFALSRGPMTQAHIYGTRYSPGWRWAHGGGFTGRPELVAEALGGQVRVLGLPSPPLTSFGCAGVGMRQVPESLMGLLRDHAVLRGNLPPGPWLGLNAVGRLSGTRRPDPADRLTWTVVSRGWRADYRWEIEARPIDLAVVEYVGPMGERLNCHNTAVADSRLTIAPRDGSPPQTFVSAATTAFEVVVPVT